MIHTILRILNDFKWCIFGSSLVMPMVAILFPGAIGSPEGLDIPDSLIWLWAFGPMIVFMFAVICGYAVGTDSCIRDGRIRRDD